ncbi:hypothetical protein STAS_02419 [Striga asiatica]|uniref:Uncharacterized protein n=1 Tax=Striga asiatica TaxID=4170 RepID=A0A5A7P2R9_STRAF|nr:hypothetical protein STAS_02419 [Striga asiatica]
MERSLRKSVPHPEIHGLRQAPEGLAGPRHVILAIRRQWPVLGPKAVVLLLEVRHSLGFPQIRRRHQIQSFRERELLYVGGGEAGGGVAGDVGEGVGFSGGGEVEGDGGGGGPEGEGRPVGDGGGDEAGLVGGDVVAEELEGGRRRWEAVDAGRGAYG